MAWQEVRTALEELTERVEREWLVEGFAVRDRIEALLLRAVGDYEAAGGHELDGQLTMAAWLRAETGRDATAARRSAVAGRKLRSLPVLAAAVLDGRLTGGQLDVVLANVASRHLARFAEHEPWLVEDLAGLTVEQTTVAMGLWRQRADALDPGPAPAERPNQLHLATTIADRGELRGSFDSDLTAVVEAALRVADPRDLTMAAPERRAAALGQVCQSFLDHQHTRPGGRHRPHLNVLIGADGHGGLTGRYLDTGQATSAAALDALRCDGAWHRVLHGDATILDYGRATRDWPVNLYNAIAVRDGGCRWPGCHAPPSWCDVHHVVEWDAGGTTGIDNGLMLCRRHHNQTHRPGHHLAMSPDATVDVTLPTGRTLSSTPRGPYTLPHRPDRQTGRPGARAA